MCPVCGGTLVSGVRRWHLVCRVCHYEGSDLEPHIEACSESTNLDEAARERALSTLRRRNFLAILDRITSMVQLNELGPRPCLLDVGCAHGWFMQVCKERFEVVGIEPDKVVAEQARKRVGPIRQGFFPGVLADDEKFDIIVFNDVLEHIPDVVATLKACNKHMHTRGLLVVNAPCRLGVIYRFTKLIAKVGSLLPFERMWQFGFPSPHVHYFDANSIGRLGMATGFEVEKQARLPSVVASGLYSRVRYSKKVSRARAALVAFAVLLSIPVLKLLPSDIEVWYLRKSVES